MKHVGVVQNLNHVKLSFREKWWDI